MKIRTQKIDWQEVDSFDPVAAALSGQFKRAQPAAVAEIPETLVTMGRTRQCRLDHQPHRFAKTRVIPQRSHQSKKVLALFCT